MSDMAFNGALYSDRIHFIPCSECGIMIDMRDWDEIVAHEDHKEHCDSQYTRSKRIE